MTLKLALPGVPTVVQHSKLRARLRDSLLRTVVIFLFQSATRHPGSSLWLDITPFLITGSAIKSVGAELTINCIYRQ